MVTQRCCSVVCQFAKCLWPVVHVWHLHAWICVACTSQQRTVRSAAFSATRHAWWATHRPSTRLLLPAYWSDWGRTQRPHYGADRVSNSGDLWVPDFRDKASSVCDGRTRWSEQQSDRLLSPTWEAVHGNAVAEETARLGFAELHRLMSFTSYVTSTAAILDRS